MIFFYLTSKKQIYSINLFYHIMKLVFFLKKPIKPKINFEYQKKQVITYFS